VLQVAEIMLTLVTVNDAPRLALALELGALLDGGVEDGGLLGVDGLDALSVDPGSMRPVIITW
jgi:hypothetical protein